MPPFVTPPTLPGSHLNRGGGGGGVEEEETIREHAGQLHAMNE